ncbi:uncharacterized protein TRIADDRAFT_58005 [Trichoplax adhaerens]|uniref:Uncharacterized protein n=1 Tax=Trichoplax adhaerens TaxID=10228 RepID=B3S2F3_TRIAD|nr:predicted protein [Trichoplax adhaerens]EDV23088.1 predicted protein [Trichoplax adhaerens]|eukprot:XP_002113998.1 predicted protein [Trichoplax adhaerens]
MTSKNLAIDALLVSAMNDDDPGKGQYGMERNDMVRLPREFHGPLVNEDSIGFQFDRRRRRQEGMKRKKRRPSSFHMNKSESASIADHVLQSISKSNVEAETQQVESKKENPNEIVTTPIAEKLMSIVRDVLNESLIEISAQIDFQSDDTEKVSNDVLENITAEHIQRLLIEMQQQDEVRQILTERINCIKNEQDDWKNYEKGLADQAQTQKDELEKFVTFYLKEESTSVRIDVISY